MSTTQKPRCICDPLCQCPSEFHNVTEGKVKATDVQIANGKMTVTFDISGLLPHAIAHQEHIIGNRNIHTAAYTRMEGGSFSTAAQYPFRTAPTTTEQKSIAFEDPFPSPPELITGLNLLDFSKQKNLRIKVSTDNITNSSFRLNATAWGDTIMHNVGCDWLAVHNPNNVLDMGVHISTGIYDTAEDTAWTKPMKKPEHFMHPVRFQKSYYGKPTVVAWICGMDMNSAPYIHLRVGATDITTQGFNINIYSWDNAIVNSVAVCWLAYPCGLPGIETGDFGGLGGEYAGWQIHGLPTGTLREIPGTACVSGQVQFQKFWNLTKAPRKVLMAFTMFDLHVNDTYRLRLSYEGLTKEGMVWRADSWMGSKFDACSGVYIALA
ncbi:hypothetical protein BDZ91DRAFT_749603 [Kalaharituber pfeilii]|nr:hypothetical protein BDZ91DRAFT_749603 [Kalaharituber pfeilii]